MVPALRIFIFFFVAAIAGTLLHECGHALMAMFFGFHPEVHYAYCTSLCDADGEAIQQGLLIYRQYPERMWITLGGPLQTILTGTIGIAGLIALRRKAIVDAYNPKHLLWIILAYFHSRWVMNSAGILYKVYVSGNDSRSDEVRLFKYWNIDVATGTWMLLIVSSLLLGYVTFVLVRNHRWQLIVYGALGSIAGGWFWLVWAGPVLMP